MGDRPPRDRPGAYTPEHVKRRDAEEQKKKEQEEKEREAERERRGKE